MKTFKFYWLNGEIEIGEGRDVADAFTRLGYGAGAMHALDYYGEITEKKQERTRAIKLPKNVN